MKVVLRSLLLTVVCPLIFQICLAVDNETSLVLPRKNLELPNPPPQGRTVSWVVDVLNWGGRAPDLNDPRQLVFPSHSFLQFGPWRDEAPFRVEIAENFDYFRRYRPEGGMVIRGLDLSTAPENQAIPRTGNNGATRHIFLLDRTVTLPNDQLLNKATGTGIIGDVWFEAERALGGLPGGDPAALFHDCTSFVHRLVRHHRILGPGITLPPGLDTLAAAGEEWSGRRPGGNVALHIEALFHETEPLDRRSQSQRSLRSVFRICRRVGTTTLQPQKMETRDVPLPLTYADEWTGVPEAVRQTYSIWPFNPLVNSQGQYHPPIISLERLRAGDLDSPPSSPGLRPLRGTP